MRPQRNPVGAEERVPRRMIIVIVVSSAPLTGTWLTIRKASIWKAAPATLINPRSTEPRLCQPEIPIANRLVAFRGIKIVAYNPSPIFLTMRSLYPQSALRYARVIRQLRRQCGHRSSLAAAYMAPKYDEFARKLRRENRPGLTALWPRCDTPIISPPVKSILRLDDRK